MSSNVSTWLKWKGNNTWEKVIDKAGWGEEIRRIVSEMLINGIKDPRLAGKMLSVSGVSVTRDGSYATCYLSLLAGTQDAEAKQQAEGEVLAGLASAKGVIEKEIAKQVNVRHIPELIFKMDHSMDYGRHIDEILDGIDFEQLSEGRRRTG